MNSIPEGATHYVARLYNEKIFKTYYKEINNKLYYFGHISKTWRDAHPYIPRNLIAIKKKKILDIY